MMHLLPDGIEQIPLFAFILSQQYKKQQGLLFQYLFGVK